MTIEEQERKKLVAAANLIVKLVGDCVGRMIFVEQIMLYGNTRSKREQIYKTLEGYGYGWKNGQWVKKEGQWALTISPWINALVAESWNQYETTGD